MPWTTGWISSNFLTLLSKTMSNLPALVSKETLEGVKPLEPREREQKGLFLEQKVLLQFYLSFSFLKYLSITFFFFCGMFRQSHDHHMIGIRLLRQPSGYTRIHLETSGGCCNGSLQLIRLLAIRIQDSHALTRGNETWTLLQKSEVWKQKEKPIGTIVIYHVSMFRNVPSILHRQIKSIPPSIPSGIFPCLQHSLVFGIAHPWQSFLDASFWVEDSSSVETRNWRWWIQIWIPFCQLPSHPTPSQCQAFLTTFFGKNSLPKNAARFLVFHRSCDHGCRPPQVAQQENLVVMVCHCNF